MTKSDVFKNLVYELSVASRPDQVVKSCINAYPQFPKLRIAIVLDENVRFNGHEFLKITSIDNKAFIKSYYSGRSLYFYDYELLNETISKNKVRFPIDYSVTFDLNIAKFIHQFVTKQDMKENHDIAIKIIFHILSNNIHIDYIFYMVENAKNIFELIEHTHKNNLNCDQFWELLNVDFRENLVSLSQFASIDYGDNNKTSNYTPSINRKIAENNLKKNSYDFYTKNQQFTKEVKKRFRLINLILIKIIIINHRSNKKENNKLKELIEFMHDDIGIFCEREMIIAYNYYKKPNLRFFNKVNIGHPGIKLDELSAKIENMAWDLFLLRFLESNTALEMEGRYFIPHFVTLDKGLSEIFDLYPVKGTIFDENTGQIFSISKFNTTQLLREICGDKFTEYYLSPEITNERAKRNIFDSGKLEELTIQTLTQLHALMNKL